MRLMQQAAGQGGRFYGLAVDPMAPNIPLLKANLAKAQLEHVRTVTSMVMPDECQGSHVKLYGPSPKFFEAHGVNGTEEHAAHHQLYQLASFDKAAFEKVFWGEEEDKAVYDVECTTTVSLSHCLIVLGPFLTCFSAPCHHTRAVWHALL